MLDYFYEQGGNFIDTAVNYQLGESEQWLGEWMEDRGRRDEMIIATKFTGQQSAAEQRQKEGKFKGQGVMKDNYGGNSAKNIHTSIERSLRNLRTTYLDIVSTASLISSHTGTHYLYSTTFTCGTTLPPYRN